VRKYISPAKRASMAGINSEWMQVLGTKPAAPVSLTLSRTNIESWQLITRTSVLWQLSMICRAASKPFIRGIWISRIARSGFDTLAFSTASSPSAASSQICQSFLAANKPLTDRRMLLLSSANNSRFGISNPSAPRCCCFMNLVYLRLVLLSVQYWTGLGIGPTASCMIYAVVFSQFQMNALAGEVEN